MDDKIKFHVGKCDFCGNTFTKIRALQSGKWICFDCLDIIADRSKMEYEGMIELLYEEDITPAIIAKKMQAILNAFRYNYDLMSAREKRKYEKAINLWREGENIVEIDTEDDENE